jgi:hypothetical protein
MKSKRKKKKEVSELEKMLLFKAFESTVIADIF